MRFSTIVSLFALAVGLAVATPVVERGDSVSVVSTPSDAPPYSGADGGEHGLDSPEATPSVEGEGGSTVTKRGDYNPLDERAPPILILCPRRGCRGRCVGYNLNLFQFNHCYFAQHPYYSAYVSSHSGLKYGVYVGRHIGRLCKGVLLRRVRTCYNVFPYGDIAFKKH